tara:strand:+ start:1643 stop:2026 length:384 start_codon:yes stop_codon:yes gene_type:complete
MADVGLGLSRKLVDRDGDPIDDGAGALNVVQKAYGFAITNAQITQGTTKQTLSAAIGYQVTGIKELIFQATHENTGYLLIKDSGSDVATEGLRLYAGDTLVLPISDTDNISIDASDAGQKLQLCWLL